MPDCGSIARLIEASTGVFPEFYGKPSRHTLDFLTEKTGFAPAELAVVGDRLYTDIALAQGTEATSILVLTGEATREEAGAWSRHPHPHRPIPGGDHRAAAFRITHSRPASVPKRNARRAFLPAQASFRDALPYRAWRWYGGFSYDCLMSQTAGKSTQHDLPTAAISA